jgi:hypothetical protein
MDRTAFFPIDLSGGSSEADQKECYRQFCEKCEYEGASVTNIPDVPQCEDTPETDAVIYTDKYGRKSVWAACHNKKHKLAYQKFWWTEGGIRNLEWLPGDRLHIDHSFNKARLLSLSQPPRPATLKDYDSTDLTDKKLNVGCIRLFAVPSDVNTAWGRDIEKPMSDLAKGGGHFRGASWMILAKLTRMFPSHSRYDVVVGAEALCGIFGLCGYSDIESLTRSYYSNLGFNSGLHLIQRATCEGVMNCFLDANEADRDPDLIEFTRQGLVKGRRYPLFDTA